MYHIIIIIIMLVPIITIIGGAEKEQAGIEVGGFWENTINR